VDTVLHFRRLHGASAGWKRILCTVGLIKGDVARDHRVTSAAYHAAAELLATMMTMMTTTMMMMVVVMIMVVMMMMMVVVMMIMMMMVVVMMIMMVMVVVMMEMASSSPRYRHRARSLEQHHTSLPRTLPFVALIQYVATLISHINTRQFNHQRCTFDIMMQRLQRVRFAPRPSRPVTRTAATELPYHLDLISPLAHPL
jgi:hypothetical protein